MSEKLKKQQLLRDLKASLLNKYGASCSDFINAEIMKLINKKNLSKQDLDNAEKNVKNRYGGGRGSGSIDNNLTRNESMDIKIERDSIKINVDAQTINPKIVADGSHTADNKSKKTFSIQKQSKINEKQTVTSSNQVSTSILPSNNISELIDISSRPQPNSQLRMKNDDVNKSVSLPKISQLNNPQELYNPQQQLNSRFNVRLSKNPGIRKPNNNNPGPQSINSSFDGISTYNGVLESDVNRMISVSRNSVSLTNNRTANVKDQLSVWDALRIHDAQKYKQEQQQHIINKMNKQKQLREFLQLQVQNKQLTHSQIQQQVKQFEMDQTMKKVQEENLREEIKLKKRKEAMQRNVEFNVQNKTLRDFNQNQFYNIYATQYAPNEGIHRLFQIDQHKTVERKQATVQTQNLLKDLINTKKLMKKNETQIEKEMEMHTIKVNDHRLKKSVDDYQDLIQSKDKRNQLILKAQKDRTLRNFSTIEQERNRSLERMFELQEFERNLKQGMLQEQKDKMYSKIKKDIKEQNLSQIEEKRLKNFEEQLVNKSMDENHVKKQLQDYQQIENMKKLQKKEQQLQMKRDLEQLIQNKREVEREQQLMMNPIEFSMNRRKLRELGLDNYNDQFDDAKSTSIMNRSQIF